MKRFKFKVSFYVWIVAFDVQQARDKFDRTMTRIHRAVWGMENIDIKAEESSKLTYEEWNTLTYEEWNTERLGEQ